MAGAGVVTGYLTGRAVMPVADALGGTGMLASWQGDNAASCTFLEDMATLARELHDSALLGQALAVLGLSLWLAGSPGRSEAALNG
jgi:hypothetical protein